MESDSAPAATPVYTARAATNDPTKYTRLQNGEVVGSEGQYATMKEAEGSVGGRRSGVKAKTLRRMLKKAGLKTSGKKATLTKRCKKAHLMRGGHYGSIASSPGAGGPAGYPFDAGMVQRGGHYGPVGSFSSMEEPAPASGQIPSLKGAGRRRGVKAKTLKKLLKKAGLKVSGKKATLRARAKKAHLVRGGLVPSSGSPEEFAFISPAGAPWGSYAP